MEARTACSEPLLLCFCFFDTARISLASISLTTNRGLFAEVLRVKHTTVVSSSTWISSMVDSDILICNCCRVLKGKLMQVIQLGLTGNLIAQELEIGSELSSSDQFRAESSEFLLLHQTTGSVSGIKLNNLSVLVQSFQLALIARSPK